MMFKWFVRILNKIPGAKFAVSVLFKQKAGIPAYEILDLKFRNKVGMNSGLDETGDFAKLFSGTGVSFSVIGPLVSSNVGKAISTIIRLRNNKNHGIVAVSIDCSSKIDNDDIVQNEYVRTFSLAYDFADLFFIDFSRKDIDPSTIRSITSAILETRFTYEEYKPIVISTGKSLDESELKALVDFCRMNGADGIDICSSHYVKVIHEYTDGRYTILGHGGIDNPDAALESGRRGQVLREPAGKEDCTTRICQQESEQAV